MPLELEGGQVRHPVIVFVCLLTYLRVGSHSRVCHTPRGERTVLSSHCGVQGVTLVLPMFLPAEPSRQSQWWVGWFLFFVRDIKSGMVAYTYNLSTWQTGAGRLQVPNYPRPHNRTSLCCCF